MNEDIFKKYDHLLEYDYTKANVPVLVAEVYALLHGLSGRVPMSREDENRLHIMLNQLVMLKVALGPRHWDAAPPGQASFEESLRPLHTLAQRQLLVRVPLQPFLDLGKTIVEHGETLCAIFAAQDAADPTVAHAQAAANAYLQHVLALAEPDQRAYIVDLLHEKFGEDLPKAERIYSDIVAYPELFTDFVRWLNDPLALSTHVYGDYSIEQLVSVLGYAPLYAFRLSAQMLRDPEFRRLFGQGIA